MTAETMLAAPGPGGKLDSSLRAATGVLTGLYSSYFSGAVALVVPEHTREALFQLASDLRSSTPKDRRFLARHASALVPRTAHGWLALGSALGFGSCGIASLACTAIALSIGGVWAVLGLLVASGLFLAGVMTALSVVLLGTALATGVVAAGALSMYIFTATTLAVLRCVAALLLGAPGQAAGPAQSQGAAAALPRIKTAKSPSAAGAEPATVGSPRKLNPAGMAAAALSEPPASGAAAASSTSPPAAALPPYQIGSAGSGKARIGSPLSRSSGGSAVAEMGFAGVKDGVDTAIGASPGISAGAPETPTAAGGPGIHI